MNDNNGKRKVCKCGCNVFRIIETASCGKCHCNGVWDDDKEDYIHDLKAIKEMERESELPIEREQCGNDGYCQEGDNYNDGCWIFECSNCDSHEMIPRMTD